MNGQNMSIQFSSSFNGFTEINSSFDRAVLKVCYVGKNRNNSSISKEVFERCMPSIYNCPIVCRYDRETDEIGAHDVDIVKNDTGGLSIVNITDPVGVVPESARYWWEDVTEEDGTTHEYLCIDVVLWKRQEAYRKIREDGITRESMEIHINEGRLHDGIYVIDDFEFTAFCLLGSAEPCYESASLEVFSLDGCKIKMEEMMREFKEAFSKQSAEVGMSIHSSAAGANVSLEGGEKALDKKKELMAKFGLTEDMLDFSLEDLDLEELEAKLSAIRSAMDDKAFALAGQFREELIRTLSAEKISTEWGECSRYWYMDHDTEASEVYCYDETDWKLYGFHYSMDGDNVVIDFESKKRMKTAIVEFDEGSADGPATFAAMFQMASEKYASDKKDWAERYQTASDESAQMKSELEDLREFKLNADKAAATAARETIFEKFENELAGVDAFEKLREDCEKFSLEDLEEKCYAILGRNASAKDAKFALDGHKSIKLPIDKSIDVDDEPYGGAFLKYNIR